MSAQHLAEPRISSRGLLTAISAGALVVAWWPVAVAVQAPAPLQLAVLLAHVCGMLAGYAVVVLLGLMSRTPALERGIGADVLARLHARGGRIVIGLIVVHAGAAVVAWARSRQENAVLALWHVLRLPWLMAATIGTLALLAVGLASVRAARRRLTYETWHTLHLLTYAGVALSFVHQLAGPDLTGHRWLQISWALLYTYVFALVLIHRVLTPMRQAALHRLRVAAVIPEGPGVVSIVVEGRHLRELRAEPGQFFRWRFLTPDTWRTAHPFSLSAPPADDRLRLTVKALGAGSTHLQDVAVGTWIVAEGPYGAMTAARRTRRNVLLIAGGVGITPMRALFETLPVRPGQDLVLLYRARGPEDLVFAHELEQIAHDRGARLFYLVGAAHDCLSAPALLRGVPDLADRDVYLCASPRMSDAVRISLREAGLPSEFLHEERFAF
ncbi:ferredoxin reductase family protein [Actinoplanes sp. M2I2]|uniref:ferredoxin reductase family protein n=1 Tax=Actinoplanes sp. M2I2 TaxID=1734444 RepID=UPI002020E697|nr:ferredoxin reductase family protein [Actinoplanes sp. M2I2]